MTCQATRKSAPFGLAPLKCWCEGDHIFHYDIRYQAWWLENNGSKPGMVPDIMPTFPHELELTAA